MASPRSPRSAPSGGRPLVIVESPAKAKTISGFLGGAYAVEASIGHIRDLPRRAADVPASEKGKPWAKLGVDVDNGFTPLYLVAPENKAQVSRLKEALKAASELYLATDEDREGEAIAWHLLEVLKPRIPVRRMVFHEITRSAIERAIEESRDLDRDLVDAQEARRILDRLYGYEVSPVLWKKIMPGLSAGRVQSVATRLIVERERARMRFRSAGWWDLDGRFTAAAAGDADAFAAGLVAVGGRRLASGRDFDEVGRLTADAVVLEEADAVALAGRLDGATFAVRSVEEKPYRRSPYAPFMTSTLQQEAGRKLRFSSQRTMGVAQRLYENGYITYMRTDSTNLSDTALSAARAQVVELYGTDYLPASPRTYVKKVKNAQEAHEAIRPAGEAFRTPAALRGELGPDELALYELIWKRTIASQMTDATGTSAQVRLGATSITGEDAEFAASGKVITFPGFLRAYVEGSDDPDAELEDRETRLPPLRVGQNLRALSIEPKGHITHPPARYTEASLVKALEELGVGRPSTYASIMETVQNRGYVWKKGTALVPSVTAFAVVGLLEQHFTDLVDFAFTARMEDDLDAIASGEQQSVPWLTRFYFGAGGPGSGASGRRGDGPGPGGATPSLAELGLKELVEERTGAIDAAEINTISLGADDDGNEIVVKPGRYGPYVKRGDDTASVPDDLAPDELTVEKVLQLLAAPKGDRVVGVDPSSGLTVYAKAGRFGPYVQLGEAPEKGSKAPKPPTSSLFSTMTVEGVTLDEALALLTLPRVVGVDPADGEEIVASNGKFGPYLRKGTDSRNLPGEQELLTITLEQALAIYAQPKQRGRRGAAPAGPLREVGADPVSGNPMVIKDGRFGAYVTDGETNASLRKGDDIATMTVDRASELLAERRLRLASEPAVTIARGRAKRSGAAAGSTAPKSVKTAPKKVAKRASKATKSAKSAGPARAKASG
jgi:DNA topoisomerase-1